MFDITAIGVAIFLDVLMIVYMLWIASFTSGQNKLPAEIGLGLFAGFATSLAWRKFWLLPVRMPHHPMMYAVFLHSPLWLWFHLISIWKLLGKEPTSIQAQQA